MLDAAAQRVIDRLQARWAGLSAAARAELVRGYADDAAKRGLQFYEAARGVHRAIAPGLLPVAISQARADALARDAHTLLGAVIAIAQYMLVADDPCARALLADASEFERQALQHNRAILEHIGTARVDFMFDVDGRCWALELNATIPAMQGYSDMAAQAWLGFLAGLLELDPSTSAQLRAGCPSNTSVLLDGVVDRYHARGGRAATPSIVIVCRRFDAQYTELQHLQRSWTAAGHRVVLAYADELEADLDGRPCLAGEPFDLVYRHVFAHKVEPGSPFARMLVEPRAAIVVNPVATTLEAKLLFACLSEVVHTPALAHTYGLRDDQLDVIARLIPWTRRLGRGPATLADGTRVDDLLAWVHANPERCVLKRSWSHGGEDVVLGGRTSLDWHTLVERSVGSPHAWIVQDQLLMGSCANALAIPGDDLGPAPWRPFFTDLCLFTHRGAARPSLVSRIAGNRVVNLHQGGGLAPVLPLELLEPLLTSPAPDQAQTCR
jgi:hypothetical protein